MAPVSRSSAFAHLFLAFAHFSAATPNAATVVTCDKLRALFPTKITFPGEPNYLQENKDYYHTGLQDLDPACIIYPGSAEDVSGIIKVLNAAQEVNFVIKSGGHSPNAGHSSIKDGVLLSTRMIHGASFDKEKGLAYVKTGGHFWDVMTMMEGTGRTVVGARLGAVGIGGYLTQGGLSFLTNSYGMAADSIVEYETVLANGTIATINEKQFPDIVRAMRGGGSQFGVVTQFTLKTYPIGDMWVGMRIYNSTKEQFNDGIQDYIGNMINHPAVATLTAFGTPEFGSPASPFGWGAFTAKKFDAYIENVADIPAIVSNDRARIRNVRNMNVQNMGADYIMRALSGYAHLDTDPTMAAAMRHVAESNAAAGPDDKKRFFMLPMIYNGKAPPNDAWGKKLNALQYTEYGMNTDYNSIISVTNIAMKYFTARTSFRTVTLPILPNNPGWFGEIEDIFRNVSTKYTSKFTGYGGNGLILQPFPRSFGKASKLRGGNAMGIQETDHDRVILEIPGVYTNKADDKLMQDWGIEFGDAVTARAAVLTKAAKAAGVRMSDTIPMFMNDAGPDQDVMATYPDRKVFAKIQKELDPNGLFSKRVGGFKY